MMHRPFWLWPQPMWDQVTLQRRLSLAEPIRRMIPCSMQKYFFIVTCYISLLYPDSILIIGSHFDKCKRMLQVFSVKSNPFSPVCIAMHHRVFAICQFFPSFWFTYERHIRFKGHALTKIKCSTDICTVQPKSRGKQLENRQHQWPNAGGWVVVQNQFPLCNYFLRSFDSLKHWSLRIEYHVK